MSQHVTDQFLDPGVDMIPSEAGDLELLQGFAFWRCSDRVNQYQGRNVPAPNTPAGSPRTYTWLHLSEADALETVTKAGPLGKRGGRYVIQGIDHLSGRTWELFRSGLVNWWNDENPERRLRGQLGSCGKVYPLRVWGRWLEGSRAFGGTFEVWAWQQPGGSIVRVPPLKYKAPTPGNILVTHPTGTETVDPTEPYTPPKENPGPVGSNPVDSPHDPGPVGEDPWTPDPAPPSPTTPVVDVDTGIQDPDPAPAGRARVLLLVAVAVLVWKVAA